MEPLREFLLDALPEKPVDLSEGEMVADAVVLFRVVDFEGQEYYRYCVTSGVTLGLAVGIIDLSKTTLLDYYTRVLAEEDDDADD